MWSWENTGIQAQDEARRLKTLLYKGEMNVNIGKHWYTGAERSDKKCTDVPAFTGALSRRSRAYKSEHLSNSHPHSRGAAQTYARENSKKKMAIKMMTTPQKPRKMFENSSK